MKVLMLNGSPKAKGNTALALEEIGRQLNAEGIEYEIFHIGGGEIRDCIGCGRCTDAGCVFGAEDGVNAFIAKAREADGFIFGTPVYYAHPSGRILSFLDRVFYSSSEIFQNKPGAAVAIARRGGTTASFDVLNKYFGISGMPVPGSSYWTIAHGRAPGEVALDEEGMRTMRNLARNMAWMLRCFEAGRKAGVPLPERESGPMTNFIR